jgi:hypothetical protein
VYAKSECVPHVVLEHRGDVRQTIGCPMRRSDGVSAGHGADKRQVSAPKTGSPAASQVASTTPPPCGFNDLARTDRDAFPAACARNPDFDAAWRAALRDPMPHKTTLREGACRINAL